MPLGCDRNDEHVSVRAILGGLGLIPSPGEEIPTYADVDVNHEVWRVHGKSESTKPSQSTEDTVPPVVKEHVPTSLRPRCRASHELLVPSTIAAPAEPQDEDPGVIAKLLPY
jgi:hypothetical protein